MQILVDADACPVKQIIVRLAKQYNIPGCAREDFSIHPFVAIDSFLFQVVCAKELAQINMLLDTKQKTGHFLCPSLSSKSKKSVVGGKALIQPSQGITASEKPAFA